MQKAYLNRYKDVFGSKRGLMKYACYKALWILGFYRRYSNVNWQIVDRVIFICMGNICRSPIAEAVGKKHGLNCRSAGLHCDAGRPADPRGQQFALKHGLQLAEHRTTPVENLQFVSTDLLVVMEPLHASGLADYALGDAQVTFAGLWIEPKTLYLHDPFSSSETYFTDCAQKIMQAVKTMAKHAEREK